MKPEEALTMEKLLNELQSVDTVKLVLTGCGESIYDSREVYEAIRPFVEKQIAKKPRTAAHRIFCPECNLLIAYNKSMEQHCWTCGQNLEGCVIK